MCIHSLGPSVGLPRDHNFRNRESCYLASETSDSPYKVELVEAMEHGDENTTANTAHMLVTSSRFTSHHFPAFYICDLIFSSAPPRAWGEAAWPDRNLMESM